MNQDPDDQHGGFATASAWLSAIVDSADDAIIGKDLDGVIRSWNRAAQVIFGYQAREIIGTPVTRLIPRDLLQEEVEILAKIRAGIRIEHYETTRLRKDGQPIRVSLTISPVRDEGGNIIGASKVARDITQQQRNDRALAHLAAIVASSDDAIISKDLDGRVTSWNLGAERLYGYLAEEMLGQSILKVIPPEIMHEEETILSRIRSGQRIQHYETTRLHKDGRRLHVSLTVSPILDTHGRVVGASKIARDISDRLEAQRQKDNFLAVLAHELRNPLAPIRTAISLFGLPGLPPEKLDQAQRIAERQIGHMASLLDDLLDVTRLSTGRVELKRSRVELRPLIQQAVDAARVIIESRRHQLQVAVPESPIMLFADPIRVAQMVTNLLTNAAKYTDPGGHIDLLVTRDHDEALIAVSDNGIGFSEETRERLFRLFSQSPEAVGRSQGGLGIGLALVKDFAERHGGSVQAHSRGPGKGSRFELRLPCEPVSASLHAH
ncbi:MAG TPA: PAS domain-containing sensor histidine kinase [Usitatibacter sp.]|nr:PAS domain-containing sensor histidine kinase [Usitatibacter sp.]